MIRTVRFTLLLDEVYIGNTFNPHNGQSKIEKVSETFAH